MAKLGGACQRFSNVNEIVNSHRKVNRKLTLENYIIHTHIIEHIACTRHTLLPSRSSISTDMSTLPQ
jgi:hypothetical protein